MLACVAAAIDHQPVTPVEERTHLPVGVVDTELRVSGDIIAALIALNPADAYRLFNIGGAETGAVVSGMTGLGSETAWPAPALIAVMLAWTAVLLIANLLVFKHKEL